MAPVGTMPGSNKVVPVVSSEVKASVANWEAEKKTPPALMKISPAGEKSKRKRLPFIFMVIAGLLVVAGGVVGALFGAGVLVFGRPSSDSQVASDGSNSTLNYTNTTLASSDALLSASALPAKMAISGIAAANFDEAAQLHFKQCVANSLDSVQPEDVYIISFLDEPARRRQLRDASLQRGLAATHLVINFAVLTGTPDTVLSDLQDSENFLNDVEKELKKTKGPLTAASILKTLYEPPSSTNTATCSSLDQPMVDGPPATLLPGSIWRLPLSARGGILVLQIHSSDLSPYLGRSYDAHPWEASPDAPSVFDCCPLWCTVTLPMVTTGGQYTYRKIPTSQTEHLATRGSDFSIARFLSQASFGPTTSEIAKISNAMRVNSQIENSAKERAVIKDWIREQIDLPPSLHRAYYRRRTNPRLFKGLVMPTGSSRAACAPGSRWSRYSFDESDRTKEIVLTPFIDGTPGSRFFSLSVDGVERTVVSEADFGLNSEAVKNTGSTILRICAKQPGYGFFMQEWVGGALVVTNATKENMDEACDNGRSWTATNPPVMFHQARSRPDTLQVFNAHDIDLRNVTASWKPDNDLVLMSKPDLECIMGLEYIQLGDASGPTFRRDWRMEMVENTLQNPAENRPSHATMSGTCPSVPPTFVNRKSCVMRPSCSPLKYKSAHVKLNRTTLRAMYVRSGKLIYVMEGLRLADSFSESECKKNIKSSCNPCTERVSRWKHTLVGEDDCVSDTILDNYTNATLARAIHTSLQTDNNPHVIDIDLKTLTDSGEVCNGIAAFGASIYFNGRCFTHVHPEHLSVVDATYWNEDHNGNTKTFYPIRAFAASGGTSLHFPSSHSMSRWKDAFYFGSGSGKLWSLGRLDDVIDFANMPVETQDLDLAKLFGAVSDDIHDAQHMACGSPGETANDPILGSKFGIQLVYTDKGTNGKFDYFSDPHNTEGKRTVSVMHALEANDQLRQRVAWSLSQIFVISEIGDLDVKSGQTEVWLAFHDILVRHGLGSYGELLKEVAYSPMMGKYLTFLNSKSFAKSGLPADENFAREIMQLFTIGLWQLNLDGSFQLDKNGAKIPTYSNKNIQSFARVWTGFQIQKFRGNIEGHRGIQSTNFLDPMKLNGQYHDVLPKIGLKDEYLGDRVQLCADIPSFSFLRKGARYINIGARPPSDGSIPGDLDPAKTSYKYGPNQHPQYTVDRPFTSVYKRLVPEQDSSLFKNLCGNKQDSSGSLPCAFPAEVVLPEDIDCHGRECFLDKEIVYVKIVDPVTSASVFYQYMKPLCVQMAFYQNPKMLGLSHNAERKMCADPRTAAGGTVCCMTPDQPGGYFGFDRCEYHLEKVTWEKAVSRCANLIDDTVKSNPPGTYNMGVFQDWLGTQQEPKRSMAPCKNSGSQNRAGLRSLDGCGYNYRASWVDEPCTIQVQIDRYSRINVVHSDTTESEVKLDSGNVFHVHWKDDRFPEVAANSCGGDQSGCSVHGETCLCSVTIVDEPVFSDADRPTYDEVLKKLKIGSPDISSFASGEYSVCTTFACRAISGVEVYIKSGRTGWDSSTIFKTSSPEYFLYNRVSNVIVGDGTFSFRNIPHFVSLRESSKVDMEAEIQALLDSLLMHENTAPFVSRRLIQHLVTSNPSPRYIESVALAFRDGDYEGIGSGKYGDLSATVAAILLDREARTPILDAEPTFGKVREPFLKLMHIMRSLEFRSGAEGKKEVVLKNQGFIGMAPYTSPSVFNFYASDFQPSGVLKQTGLYAPEMMLGTAPYLLSFLNGVNSLIKYGLSHKSKGFGSATGPHPAGGTSLRDGDGSREENGFLTFKPQSPPEDASAVISELDILLTHGRLDAKTRGIIENAYQDTIDNGISIKLPGNVQLRLDSTDFGCIESHQGATFRLTLQKTEEIKHGFYENVYFSNGRDSRELKVNSIRHWAWVGKHLFLNQGPNDPSPALNCSLIRSIFNPGDILHLSSTSRTSRPDAALQLAQSLFISSAEFHTANGNRRAIEKRHPPYSVQTKGRKYKAIIVVFMNGGADSWNFLVPRADCQHNGEAFDLYAEYENLRATAALPLSSMLAISSPNDSDLNKQPCSGYGVNPALENIKDLYSAGDAAFIANVGTLVEPLTRAEYEKKLKKYPASLYSHNSQQRTSKTVHAGASGKPKGILGRITEALTEQSNPYAAASYSMSGVQIIFDGKYNPFIIQGSVERLSDELEQKKYLEQMLNEESDHGFSEAFSALLNRSIVDSDHLGGILASASKKPSFFSGDLSRIEKQMKHVASVILARGDTHNEREAFYVEMNGFDSHFEALKSGSNVYERLEQVDKAIKRLKDEMTAEGIWDDVLVVSASDFGRKLVSNGGGTDHAWGGNYFIAGGSVRGGQILGDYPSRLDETCELNIRNSGGRFIPSTSWEAVWSPVAEWFGVDSSKIDGVLPNKANFPASDIFDRSDLFEAA